MNFYISLKRYPILNLSFFIYLKGSVGPLGQPGLIGPEGMKGAKGTKGDIGLVGHQVKP